MAVPIPQPRGAQALQVNKTVPFKPPKITPTKTPGVPKAGSPGWKQFTEERWAANHSGQIAAAAAPKPAPVTPQDAALAAFHTALAQIQGAVPAVDPNAVMAPYKASEVAAGQLGTGLQGSVLQSGQAAQQQYQQGLGQAQQQAAQFGIAAGGSPTQLQNNGTQQLATQTNAYAAAAPAAAAAWQALLERTGANAVNTANQNRASTIASGSTSLAASIPSLINDAKTQAFQQKTEGFNERLAETQLTDKQAADLRDYNLNVTKANNTAANDKTTTSISASRLAETKRHDRATEKGLATRARAAAKTGAKGIPQVLAALKISTGTGATTTKAAKGFDVQVQPWGIKSDGTTGALGPAVTKHLPRLDATLPGYKILTNTATTHYETVPSSGTAGGGMTLAQWNKAVGIYQQYNGVSKSDAVKAVQQITPRPPK